MLIAALLTGCATEPPVDPIAVMHWDAVFWRSHDCRVMADNVGKLPVDCY